MVQGSPAFAVTGSEPKAIPTKCSFFKRDSEKPRNNRDQKNTGTGRVRGAPAGFRFLNTPITNPNNK